jgi:hypothetical protein
VGHPDGKNQKTFLARSAVKFGWLIEETELACVLRFACSIQQARRCCAMELGRKV